MGTFFFSLLFVLILFVFRGVVTFFFFEILHWKEQFGHYIMTIFFSPFITDHLGVHPTEVSLRCGDRFFFFFFAFVVSTIAEESHQVREFGSVLNVGGSLGTTEGIDVIRPKPLKKIFFLINVE